MGENVKDLLEDLKNTSELILDLGYSSVLFENKDIAKEVEILYDNIDDIEEKLYIHLFAAARGKTSKKLIGVMDIAESAWLVSQAARNLAELTISGRKLHPIIRDALKDTDETIFKVRAGKYVSKKSLMDLGLRKKYGVNIIAIRRKKKWVFNPHKYTKLKENDILMCVGSKGAKNSVKKLLER